MRQRTRDLVESDPYAKKFIALVKTNVFGPHGLGFKNVSADDNGVLDYRANGLIKEAWEAWGKKQNCTVSGDLSWLGVQHLSAETEPVEGEIIARKVRGFESNEFKYALQLIEPECLDHEINKRLDNGHKVRLGIEFDTWGRRVRYLIRKDNPNDMLLGDTRHEPVKASDIVHKFLRLHIKQSRGVPWMHPVLEPAQMLRGYDEASLVAARAGAAKMGFLTRKTNADGEYTGEGKDIEGNVIADLAPGTVETLPIGWEYHSHDPDYPHEQYPQFVKAQLRRIASGLLVSYNSLGNDLEGVNYSSIRAGLLEERDVWKMLQRDFIENFAADIFADWLFWCLGRKIINLPFEKFAKFNKPRFQGRGWAWVDPEKDTNAAIKAIENGLSSRAFYHEENGTDEDETYRDIEEGDTKAAVHGLNFNGQRLRDRAETFGILSRGGFITPQQSDEAAIRYEFDMPEMGKEVQAAWKSDGGVRRPITLQSQDGFENTQKAQKPAPAKPAE